VVPFIDDMQAALSHAELVIGRAGASAVSEVCAVGRPSLLIPYPYAGDHQRHNAHSLERRGASLTLLADQATAGRLAHELRELLTDRAKLQRMADAARALGRPQAARVLARDLLAFSQLSSCVPRTESAGAGNSSEAIAGERGGSRGERTSALPLGEVA
jgi:UDP-N-acetylglucosamine--N-acetylmuramyl-(pentapeptide) pyrophosphoryl-undecaprenol N-acetylglucosamine transferase